MAIPDCTPLSDHLRCRLWRNGEKINFLPLMEPEMKTQGLTLSLLVICPASRLHDTLFLRAFHFWSCFHFERFRSRGIIQKGCQNTRICHHVDSSRKRMWKLPLSMFACVTTERHSSSPGSGFPHSSGRGPIEGNVMQLPLQVTINPRLS